jgi:hypothetical protein
MLNIALQYDVYAVYMFFYVGEDSISVVNIVYFMYEKRKLI